MVSSQPDQNAKKACEILSEEDLVESDWLFEVVGDIIDRFGWKKNRDLFCWDG